jgi:hypothetical protein
MTPFLICIADVMDGHDVSLILVSRKSVNVLFFFFFLV